MCSVICKSIFYQEEVKQSVKALDYREEVLLYKMHTLRVTKTKKKFTWSSLLKFREFFGQKLKILTKKVLCTVYISSTSINKNVIKILNRRHTAIDQIILRTDQRLVSRWTF